MIANYGQMVAEAWESAVRDTADVFGGQDWQRMWTNAIRHGINANGEATRPMFGLLTPTLLSDDELWDRE